MSKKEITYFLLIAILVSISEFTGILTLLPIMYLGMLIIYKYVPEIEKEYEEKERQSNLG